jgi:hypothetical protein
MSLDQRTLQRLPRPSERVYTLVFGASTITLALVYIQAVVKSFGETTMDDAYMFARYAEHALDGLGFAWNPDGVQTYGSTSILFQILIIALRAAMPMTTDSALLNSASAVAGLLSLVLMTAIAAHFTSFRVRGSPCLAWATAVGTLFLIPGHFRFHSATGMDTMLSFLCNTLLILATLQFALKTLPFPILVLCAYLSYAARPDNLIYAVLFPVLGILLLDSRRRKRSAIYFLLGLGGLVVLDTLAKLAVFGDPLPLPFYAKSSGYYDGYLGIDQWNSMEYLLAFVAMALPFLGLIVLALDRRTIRLCVVFLTPLALTAGYYFRVVQIMGQEARYYYPSLPFIAVCSFLVLDRYLSSGGRKADPEESTLARIMAFGLLAALATSPFLRGLLSEYYAQRFIPTPTTYVSALEYDALAVERPPKLGWSQSIAALAEVAVSLPPGTHVALSEYGYIGAAAPHVYILDPIGLHDPYFAHHGFSAQEFFRRQPDLIWLPHPDYSRIVSEILNAAEFCEAYDYYPGAFDHGLAIRRNSAYYEPIYDLVGSAWRKHYGDAEMSLYLARASR